MKMFVVVVAALAVSSAGAFTWNWAPLAHQGPECECQPLDLMTIEEINACVATAAGAGCGFTLTVKWEEDPQNRFTLSNTSFGNEGFLVKLPREVIWPQELDFDYTWSEVDTDLQFRIGESDINCTVTAATYVGEQAPVASTEPLESSIRPLSSLQSRNSVNYDFMRKPADYISIANENCSWSNLDIDEPEVSYFTYYLTRSLGDSATGTLLITAGTAVMLASIAFF